MAPKKKDKKETKRTERVYRNNTCFFCDTKTTPDYKKIEEVAQFVTDRARIIGRSRSGICAKHQRRLSTAVKRLRHLGLLPFKVSV